MNFFTVLFKLSTIMEFVNTIARLIAPILKRDNPLPTCEETTALLAEFKKLIEKKVVKIPGVDEAQLLQALEMLNANIMCSVTESHRNIARFGDMKGRALVAEEKPQGEKA